MESKRMLKEKLKQIEKEYEKKQRKLKKHNRAVRAKEHVKKTLRKQASLQRTVPVNKSDSNEVKYVESHTSIDASTHSREQAKYLNERQTHERVTDSACEGNKGVEQYSIKEKTTDEGASVKPHVTTSNSNVSDTGANGKYSESAVLSVYHSDGLMAVSADENSCGQDIFSSPKPASRTLFEDVQKTILNRKDLDVSSDRLVTSEQVRNDTFTDVSEQIKEVQNIENAVHAMTCVSDRNVNKESICQNSDNYSFQSASDNSPFDGSGCVNHHRTSIYANKVSKDNDMKGRDKQNDKTAEYNSVNIPVDTDLDKTIGKASSNATVHECVSPINSLNSASETTSESLKGNGKDTIEITETLVKNLKANAEVVLAVSETPTDSVRTIPSSIEDFVNIKSRCRKRRSTSGKRRQSLRIAELSSQESSRSNSDSLLSDFYVAHHVQKSKPTDKTLVVSSIFQCLLDEVKRENSNTEFSLPSDFSEDFEHLQLGTEKEMSEVLLQTESNTDTEAQCCNEAIQMKVSERLPNERNSSIDDTELGLNEKTKCLKEKREQTQQLEHNSDQFSSVSLTKPDRYTSNSNSKQTEVTKNENVPENENRITNSSSKLHVQVTCVPDKDDQDNSILQTSENLSCMSPPLFESQTDKHIAANNTDSNEPDTDTDINCSPRMTVREVKVGCRASPARTAVLPEDQEELDQSAGLTLEQTHIFQIPKMDQLIGLVIGETNEKLHIVCLCSVNLRFYRLQNDEWSCYHIERLGFSVKKNSGCSITLVPDTLRLCVVLQQRKTDSVKLILYTSSDAGVHSYHVDSLWSRSVLLCPSMRGEFIASHATDQKTYLTKYTLTDTDDVQRQNFDPILDEITSLCSVRGKEAMLGLSVTGQLYVWNHKQMSLLTTVDVSDVSLQDMICSHSFYEEGFLFVTVFSRRKGQQAGSLLVVNPQMGTCETLTALESRNHRWTGCATAVLVQDEYIIVRENSGTLLIWDIYTGVLVSTLKETSVSCITSTLHSVAVCHKQCVHVYKIEDSDEIFLGPLKKMLHNST